MQKNITLLGLLMGSFLLFFYIFPPTASANPEYKLKAYFLNVGQGDATLIHTPENKWILIDGGPDENSTLEELKEILPKFQNKIDLIVLSHPHKDHIQGLYRVLEEYKVGSILMHEIEGNALQEKLIDQATQKNIPLIEADPSKDIQMDSLTYLDILTPLKNTTMDTTNINNLSVVMALKSGGHSILFTGDAEEIAEKALLKSGYYLSHSILKGGHHGSKTSTSIPFLSAVNPQYVIYMNGKNNSFHHPSPETLKKLDEKNIRYWNTSQNGRVSIECPYTYEECTFSSEFE